MKSILMAIALASMVVPSAWAAGAANPDSLFTRGCDAYESGDFDSALGFFEAAGRSGVEDAALFYNLGNTHFRLGSLGMAVADYRRALMLEPRDEDVKANLEFVRTMVGTRDTLDALGVQHAADIPLMWLSPEEIHVIFYVLYYLAALAFLGLLFMKGGGRRLSLYVLVVIVCLAVLSFSISAHAVSRFRNSDGAVVTGEEVELRSGPGNAFERIATLRDGVEVTLKSRSAMWVEVELPGGEVGWLRDTEIQRISPARP
jgi:tetratricopeptide (TPR) repeat protein